MKKHIILAIQLIFILTSIAGVSFVAVDLYSMGEMEQNVLRLSSTSKSDPYRASRFRTEMSQARQKQFQATVLFCFAPISLIAFGISAWQTVKRDKTKKIPEEAVSGDLA